MTTNGAEIGSRTSQSNTQAESFAVNAGQAKNDEKTKLPAEQEIDQPSGAPESLSGHDHDMVEKAKEQSADEPPFTGSALNDIVKEEMLNEHLVRQKNGENLVLSEEKNEENDAQQAEIQKSLDQTSLANGIDARARDMDDNETTTDLKSKLVDEVDSFLSRKPLLERVRLGPRRVVQSMSYLQLIEDRLVYLERKVGDIGKGIKLLSGQAVEETEKPGDDEVIKEGRPLILEVNRISVAQDQERKQITVNELWDFRYPREDTRNELIEPTGFQSKLWTGHIIDVLVPDPGFENAPISLSANVKRHTADQAGLGLNEGRKQNPSRVRIHSTLLLALLEHISDQPFTICEQEGQSHQTFLQPFKFFVTYEKEIRKWAESLQEKHKEGSLPSKSNREAKDASEKVTTESRKSSEAEQDTVKPPYADDRQAAPSDTTKNRSMTESDKEARFWTKECLDQLSILIELFENDLKPVFDDRHDAESGQLGSIAYADLWHIFACGEEIQSGRGQPQIYRVLTTVGGRPFLCTKREAHMPEDEENDFTRNMYRTSPTEGPFFIQAFYYDFDGTAIGPVEHKFTIQPFEGRRLITSLPCYPIRFAKGATDVSQYRKELVERGRRFVQLATDSQRIHYRYCGLTLEEASQSREQIDSDIILDFTMAFLKNKEWEPSIGIGPQLQPDPRETKEILDTHEVEGQSINEAFHKDHNVDSQRLKLFLEQQRPTLEPFANVHDIKPDDFLICPSRVYGFVLRTRKWASFMVSLVEDIRQQEASFDKLVLPEGHRETLLALVETHAQAVRPGQDNQFQISKAADSLDLVRGKGKGLIILLHGEPGVGKTSTAESVAAYTNRPLFAITCGDIGQTAEQVESRLETNFQLAHRWGCVLLLDEADVFLDRRSKQDLQRNAIVSVFLRVLEYYSGILFLTTNRIGTFDPAFRSRIHMSLYYPRLDEASTKKVWDVNMDRSKVIWKDKIQFEEKNVADILSFAIEHYKDLRNSKATWNGRQIRNAFQTAIAIAEYEAHRAAEKYKLAEVPKACLERSHFEKVAKASSHFDQYLRETWGGTERDMAREGHERRDEFADSDYNDRHRRKRKSGGRRRGSEDESSDDGGRTRGIDDSNSNDHSKGKDRQRKS